MILYDYLCATCGPFRLALPMGAAGRTQPCRSCGVPAPRTMTAPALGGQNRALHAALGRAESSAHEPAVVTAVPPRAAPRRAPANPLHRRLPKP